MLKLGPVGESVSDRFLMVGHFSRRGKWLFYFPSGFSRLQKGIWNLKTINLLVREANRGRDGCDPVAVPPLSPRPRFFHSFGGKRGVEALVYLLPQKHLNH